MSPEEIAAFDAIAASWAMAIREINRAADLACRAFSAWLATIPENLFPIIVPRPARRRLPPARRANGHRYAMRAKGRYER